MVEDQDFRPMMRRPGDGGERAPLPPGLLERLRHRVVEPFALASKQAVVVEPLAPEVGGPPMLSDQVVVHPLCRPFVDSEHCRQSWQSHLADWHQMPVLQWHRCPHGLLCATVPVEWSGRCLAVCKLVCPNTTAQETFECYAELLEALVEHVVAKEQPAVAGTVPPGTTSADGVRPGTVPPAEIGRLEAPHPQVSRAIEFIESQLSEPGLTVRRVTGELKMNYSYLAHLFTRHAGMRMSRYITMRRVEKAKTRLASTDWQVKRIAFECGYVSADWFSHVFHTITGLTPGEYRAAVHGRAEPLATSPKITH